MAIPYERVATAPVARSARPPLVRPVVGRRLGGVCAGVAVHLGLPVRTIRLATLVLVVFGTGLPAYLFLWALVPSAAVHPPSPGPLAPGQPSGSGAGLPHAAPTLSPPVADRARHTQSWGQRAVTWFTSARSGPTITLGLIGVGLLVLLTLQAIGFDVQAGLLAPCSFSPRVRSWSGRILIGPIGTAPSASAVARGAGWCCGSGSARRWSWSVWSPS